MSKKKNQHYLSQFHIRNFSCDGEKVWSRHYDVSKGWSPMRYVPVRSLCFEKSLYSVEPVGGDISVLHFENWFSDFEACVSSCIRQYKASYDFRYVVSDKYWHDLLYWFCLYTLSVLFRSPSFVAYMRNDDRVYRMLSKDEAFLSHFGSNLSDSTIKNMAVCLSFACCMMPYMTKFFRFSPFYFLMNIWLTYGQIVLSKEPMLGFDFPMFMKCGKGYSVFFPVTSHLGLYVRFGCKPSSLFTVWTEKELQSIYQNIDKIPHLQYVFGESKSVFDISSVLTQKK